MRCKAGTSTGEYEVSSLVAIIQLQPGESERDERAPRFRKIFGSLGRAAILLRSALDCRAENRQIGSKFRRLKIRAGAHVFEERSERGASGCGRHMRFERAGKTIERENQPGGPLKKQLR